jgi:heat shock protein HtpX
MNTVKTFFLLMVMTGLLLMVGGILGGEGGLIIALFFALIMNFGAYWFSDRIALKMAHAHPVTEEEDPDLYRIVAEQAELAGLPMPKVYEIESDSPNAFATGRSPKHGTVAVTTGIRHMLDRRELGAVLAHEMAHVGNRDTLIMAVVATFAGAISMLAFMAQLSAIFGGFGGHQDDEDHVGGMIGLLVAAIVMPITAALVQAAISRTREF